MADLDTTIEDRAPPGALRAIGLTAAAIVALGVVAAVLVFRFADAERARELAQWQARLALVADTRAAAVDGWLARQFDELTGLAENESLQLYAVGLAEGARSPAAAAEAEAFAGYLRNLLAVVADRAGFVGRPLGPDAAANVKRVGVAGLALVDLGGSIVAATEGMPAIDGRLRTFLDTTARGERGLLDMHRGPAGTPTMGFAVPLSVAAGNGSTRQIGWVLGVKEVARELFPLLRQPGATWQTAEALLVRRSGAGIEYLSPTRDGKGPLELTLAADPDRLAAAYAAANPGGFAQRRDYRAETALVTGRAVANAPWTLVYKIDAAEALGDSESRLTRLVAILLLAVAAACLALFAAWRHGASRRAAAVAGRYRDLAARYEAQSRLLRLVTDNQPSSIVIVGDDGRVRFANRTAADRVQMEPPDMVGKPLANVIGSAEAARYERFNATARQAGTVVTDEHRSGANGDLRVALARHVPVPPGPDVPAGVLVVEQDITEAVRERERRGRTLARLVGTLVTLLDRRDPYSANHSERTATIARDVAADMGLDESMQDTVETAARLMNIGKILVPAGLLTRVGGLDEAEIKRVRDSIQAGADLLDGIEFDGPVVETLRQLYERWDGTGEPAGLKGEAILVSARIAAVANAFVAMTSPRAWRAGMDFDAAMDALSRDAGKAYDRRVVVSLCHLIENRGARETWGADAARAAH